MVMGWVRIDDMFYSHPKVLAAGNAAVGLWVRALAYANAYLTDGHINAETLRTLGATRRYATTLVKAGLWEPNGNGWDIHDFADYQESREEIETRRADLSRKRSDAGRLGAQKRWHGDGNSEGKLP